MTIGVIQVGRAVAAIAVAAFHLSISMGQDRYGGHAAFGAWTRLGYLGVDFFFVLSGFIICYAHRQDVSHPERWGAYIQKRFIRVYPFYWLVLLLYGLAWHWTPVVDAGLPQSFEEWMTSLVLIRFSDGRLPIQVAWTLFHEVAFYLAFSALIVNVYWGAASLGMFFVGSALVFAPIDSVGGSAWSTYFSLINIQFLLGMLAYFIFDRAKAVWLSLVIGVGIFALGVMHLSEAGRLVVGLGLALIIGSLSAIEQRRAWVFPGWLMLVGGATYSIYLIHTNLEGLLLKVFSRVGLISSVGPEGVFVAVLTLTVIMGCMVHAWVERPLLNWVRRRLP